MSQTMWAELSCRCVFVCAGVAAGGGVGGAGGCDWWRVCHIVHQYCSIGALHSAYLYALPGVILSLYHAVVV
jgi:hypothetical protein